MGEARESLMGYEVAASELKRLVMAVNARAEALGCLGTTELTWVPSASMSVEVPTVQCEVDLPL